MQGTDDAALHKDLKLPAAQLIIRKGNNQRVDSDSAFEGADRKTVTGLAGCLKARGITEVLTLEHEFPSTTVPLLFKLPRQRARWLMPERVPGVSIAVVQAASLDLSTAAGQARAGPATPTPPAPG